jgi:hypothetical protein
MINGEVSVPDGPGLGIEPVISRFEPFLASHIATDATGTHCLSDHAGSKAS